MGKRVIARVIGRLNIGGPAQQAIALTSALNGGDYRSVLFAGQEDPREGSLWQAAEAAGVSPVRVPGLARAIRPAADLIALAGLTRHLRSLQPHLVHTHTAKAGTVGRVAALLAGVPVRVHTFHGHVLTGYFGPAATALFRRIEAALARRSTLLIAVSPRQRRELIALGVAEPGRIAVIPLGRDLAPFLNAAPLAGRLRAELGLSPETPLVGVVARLVPIKGVDLFLRAAALLHQRVPEVRFVIAGDGPEREALEGQAAALGLGGALRFLGWRHDLPALYAGLDLVVLSSRNEGTPVCLLEAMAAGVPVVAAAVGGVEDLVQDRVTGRLTPPSDVGALASTMTEVLADRRAAQAYAAAARAAVFPKHDIKTLIAGIRACYTRLLEGGAAGRASCASW
ncbi:MAG: glycosyltransferase [candidate division NC10 bacterium]|nr:glycosyltransferase [candidate division NC10 bacterium]